MTQAKAAGIEAPRRRWWRRRRVGLIALCVLGAVCYWIGTTRLDGWLQRTLEQQVRTRLGGELTFESFEVHPARLEIAIEGAELRLPDNPLGSIEARLDSARVQVRAADLLALSAGKIRFSSLRLVRPSIIWHESPEAPAVPDGAGSSDPRPWQVRIGRLEVEDGSFIYGNRTVPWEIDARHLAVEGGWSRLRSTIEGSAAFDLAISHPPLRRPLRLRVDSRFRLDRHGVEIRTASIAGDGLTASFEGSVDLENRGAVAGRGEARWNLHRLEQLLPQGSPALAGLVSSTFTIEASPTGRVMLGTIQSDGFEVDAWSFRRLQARARFLPGKLELSEITGESLGGAFDGSGEMQWDEGQRFDLRINSHALRLAELLEALGLGDVPLDAAMDGSARLWGAPLDRGSWGGEGEVRLSEAADSGTDIPLSGPAQVAIERGRVRIEGEFQLSSTHAKATIEADLTGRTRPALTIEGSTPNYRDTQLALMHIVSSMGESLPDIARERLDGSGHFDARFTTDDQVALSLDLDIDDGHYGRQSFERLELALELLDGGLSLRRLDLREDEQRLLATAALTLEPLVVHDGTLTAQGVSLDWISTAAEVALPADGVIDAELSLRDGHGGGRVVVRDGRIQGQPFDVAQGTLRFTPDRIDIERWRIASAGAQFEGTGSWIPESWQWTLNIDSGQGELAKLPVVTANTVPLSGQFEFAGSIHDEGEGILGSGRWTVRDSSYAGVRIGTVSGTSELSDGSLLNRLSESDERWSAQATIAPGEPASLDARVRFDDWLYEVDTNDPNAGWALMSGSLDLAGPLDSLEAFAADGDIEVLEFWRGNQNIRVAEAFSVGFSAGVFSCSPLRLEGGGTAADIELWYDLPADRLRATAKGTLDLGLLVAGWPEIRAAGPVQTDLRVEGSLAHPRISGEARGESGRIQWLGLPQRVEQLSWQARFEESRVTLDDLRARLGNGEILGRGQAQLSASGVGEFLFELDGANVRLEYPDGFRGLYEGELNFAGTPQGATVGGEIRLVRGVYENEFAFGGGVTPIQAAPDTTLPDWIDLDIRIHAEDHVWVRNELAQLESSLDLSLGGSLRRPQLTGRAALLDGGELRFREVEYDVISGSLDLLELERIDPYLTLRAQTEVDEYTVYLRVEGTISSFDFDLTSTPSLTTPDIIALLTTGRTLGETGGQGSSSPSGDLAANYFGGALTGPFERQLEKLLGLKRVRIDPLLAEGESDPTTRLTLGEQVTDDIFVIFSTDLTNSENQLYSVNWKATPRVRIGVERDTQGGVGADIRYTARFWLHPPPAKEPSGEPDAADGNRGQRLRVNSVVIEGVDPEVGEELRKELPFASGDEVSRTSIFRGVESLKRWCVRRRQLEARIDAEVQQGSDGVDVVYRVDSGPIVDLQFEGLSKGQRKRLLEELETRWVDAVLVDELFDDTRQVVLEHFQEQGHYAADVTFDLDESPGQRKVTYSIDLGRPVRIGAVEIAGIERVDPSQLRALLELRPTSMLSRRVLTPAAVQRDAERIRAFYRNEGFLDVQVADPSVSMTLDGGSADVAFELTEGARFQVAAVTFNELEGFSHEQLANWALIKSGDVFSGPEVLRAESRLRAAIDGAGYPDVRVSGLARLDGNTVRLDFQIVPGQRQMIESIEIVGNRLTQEKIVRRELQLTVGNDASRDGLLRSQHALYRLGIFSNVRLDLESVAGTAPGSRRLRVEVEEEPPMSSSVAVGWDSEALARLGLSLTHDNVGGYDRVLSIQGKISSLEERIQLIGEEPRFLNRPLKALFSIGYSRDEEEGFAVSRNTAAFRIEKKINPKWRALARYSFQRVNLSDITLSASELQVEKLVDGRLGDFGLAFVRDTRDNPFSPTRGNYITVGSRLFAAPFGSEFDFVKSSGNISYLFGLSPRTSFATGVRAGVAIPYGSNGAVPISEAFFAGGDSTVRGFARDTLGPAGGGEAMLIFNQEYRFPIWGALRGVVFYDSGNVWITRSEIDTEFRDVFGAGLRFETPVGPLRLEYGGKLDRKPGESIGEFFLAIGNAF